MQKRNLGKTNLQIAPLVFGGNVFGWTIEQKKSFSVLDAFTDHGFNFIDTADVYSAWVPGNKGGESEIIIGNWMQERKNRDKVLVATKVGMQLAPDKKGLKKDYIIKSCEDSLLKLKTDYIDLYQAHKDDDSTPLEESLAAFDSLIQSGKVRAIGASNYEAPRLAEALRTSASKNLASYMTLQPEYNLYDRQHFESGLEKVCAENNLGVITYYSLASGFLSGKYRNESDISKSPRGEGIKKRYLNDRGLRILSALDNVASEVGASAAQISLAWLLHRPSVTAPIVSATSVEQLQDIAKSVTIKLNPDHLGLLDKASAY